MSFLIGLLLGFITGGLLLSENLNQTIRAFYKAIGCEIKYKAKKPQGNNT